MAGGSIALAGRKLARRSKGFLVVILQDPRPLKMGLPGTTINSASMGLDFATIPATFPAMNSIAMLTPQQLRDAADLQERVEALQNELNELLDDDMAGPAQAAVDTDQSPDRPKNGRRKKRRRLSPEGRANIIAATKARWAARRGEVVPEQTPAAEPVKRKRRISRALREARSAAMKARWAKARRAGRSRL